MIFLIGASFKTNYLVNEIIKLFNARYQELFKDSFIPELVFVDQSPSSVQDMALLFIYRMVKLRKII